MLSGTMSRPQKGRIAPAPKLAPAAQRVADRVATLANVSVQAHWEIGSQDEVNGTDFYVGEDELGHIHLDGEAHIPVGESLAKALIAAKLAKRFRWSPVFVVADTDDLELTAWIFELRHAQIAGESHAALTARIAARR